MAKKSKSRAKPENINRKKIPDLVQTSVQQHQGESGPLLPHRPMKVRSFKTRRNHAIGILSGKILPDKFLYRQKEIQEINGVIDGLLSSEKSGCKVLLVTGSPGGGKTLSVNTVLKKREETVVKLNANLTKNIKEIHEVLFHTLLNRSDGKDLSSVQIIRELQKQWRKNSKCILYIEEIQLLFRSHSDQHTSQFFTLFTQRDIQIMLIGTSNTIDAIQKYEEKLNIKIPDIKNIVFRPYTQEMIRDILKQKLDVVCEQTDIKIDFPEKLMMFSARKIAATRKGDIRFALQFLKCVVSELLFMEFREEEQIQTVSVDITNKVFSKMNRELDGLITAMPYQQQVLLIALYVHVKRTEAIQVNYKQLNEDLKWICESMRLGNKKELLNGFQELEQYNFVTRRIKNGQTRVRLKLSLKDIEASFAQHPVFKKFFAEQG